jgi:hypothetical protein
MNIFEAWFLNPFFSFFESFFDHFVIQFLLPSSFSFRKRSSGSLLQFYQRPHHHRVGKEGKVVQI